MLSPEQIKDKLKDRRIGMVAEAIGVTRQTLYNFLSGKTESPSHELILKLSNYLEDDP
jgi:transcriptional regulator with XRE-family HTH domain